MNRRCHASLAAASLVFAGICGLPAARAAPPCDGGFQPEPVPEPSEAEVVRLHDIVVVAPDDIWAVGFAVDLDAAESLTVAMHYDGTAWSIMPSPSPENALGKREAILEDVDAVAPDLVYAAGSYTNQSVNSPDTLVLKWDGQSWTHLESPGQSGFGASGFLFEAVKAIDAEHVWFGGQFNRPPGRSRAAMVRYDGSSFEEHLLPRDPNVVNGAHRIRAIDALGPDDVWAAGSAGGVAVAVGASYVAHWNGSSWQHIPTPHPGFGEMLRDVVALAPDDVWVSGHYDVSPPEGGPVLTFPLFLHWDGSAWTQFQSPAYAEDLVALAPDDIYGVEGTQLVHWDGSAWSLVAELDVPDANFNGVDAAGACDLVAVGHVFTSTQDNDPLVVRFAADELPGDVDGDGVVGFGDLLAVLGAWGPCSGCPEDLDGDGAVGLPDLLIVLSGWS